MSPKGVLSFWNFVQRDLLSTTSLCTVGLRGTHLCVVVGPLTTFVYTFNLRLGPNGPLILQGGTVGKRNALSTMCLTLNTHLMFAAFLLSDYVLIPGQATHVTQRTHPDSPNPDAGGVRRSVCWSKVLRVTFIRKGGREPFPGPVYPSRNVYAC